MLQEFLENLNIKQKKIAVGVSGGADSLGAVLMCAEELKQLGYQIIALTVDHKLRPTSSKEAAFVHQIMRQNNIEHFTLVWQGEKPQTGIEEAARAARYDLLENWCQKNGIQYLITAHHLCDQAETFFMRLLRGSGLDGLCGMKEISPYKSLFILRPFLKTHPETFKAFLTARHIHWIEDESNSDEKLLRVKMRKFLPILEEKTGITVLKIANTMERLQTSRTYFEHKIDSLIANNFKSFKNKAFSCPLAFFLSLQTELQYRLLAYLLKKVAKTPYQPESEKIFFLMSKLKRPDFKSATLNHCKIKSTGGFLWIVPENVLKPANAQKCWKTYLERHPNYKKHKIPFEVKYILLERED
ncbi:MAG: tRNA lysidine(34) synthetase TilS [Alphaproteobacteria bacterium]|nr:tRNA lysidine(34) synthetase TilS [Alphaproteobacteria bacterium]